LQYSIDPKNLNSVTNSTSILVFYILFDELIEKKIYLNIFMISKHSLSKCLKKVQNEKELRLSSKLNKVYFSYNSVFKICIGFLMQI
jgi:hypothetical protein